MNKKIYSRNNFKKWTKEDEELLMDLIDNQGLSLRKAGDKLQRSYSAVVGKRGQLRARYASIT